MEARIQGRKHQFEPLSYKVIGACIDVQRQLGTHCREIDYQRALEIAFQKFGIQFECEVDVPIMYDGVQVSTRRVDFRCWDTRDELFLESKAIRMIRAKDTDQRSEYVTKGNQKLILLVNFWEKPLRPRRFVNTPDAKATKSTKRFV